MIRVDRSFRSSAGEIAFGAVGQGPDVLLVHGTPSSSVIWEGVVERLADSFRFHFLDLPGYGASEKHEGQDVRLRTFARVVAELVEHVGLTRPVLVGHDFGGATVLGAHLVEGVDTPGIAVADAVAVNPWGTPFSLHVRDNKDTFAAVPGYVHEAVIAAHLQTTGARPLPDDMVSALVAPWTGDEGQAAYYRQVALYDHEYTARLEPLYPTIAVPTLVLWGAEDGWIPLSAGRRLHGMIPGAALEVLPDAGHFSMIDTPGLFARLLGGWLATLERSTATAARQAAGTA